MYIIVIYKFNLFLKPFYLSALPIVIFKVKIWKTRASCKPHRSTKLSVFLSTLHLSNNWSIWTFKKLIKTKMFYSQLKPGSIVFAASRLFIVIWKMMCSSRNDRLVKHRDFNNRPVCPKRQNIHTYSRWIFKHCFKDFQYKTIKNILTKNISTSQFHINRDCPLWSTL